jgi:ribonuclease HI
MQKIIKRTFSTSSINRKYYAVRAGRQIGIFTDWEECKKQVANFKSAEYKSFHSMEEAQTYLNTKSKPNVVTKPVVSKPIHTMSITSKLSDEQTYSLNDEEIKRFKKKQDLHQSDKALEKFNYITAYTDGSCLGNGTDKATAGIGVFFDHDDPRNISMPFIIDTESTQQYKLTNQRAEVQAVIICLAECVKDEDHIRILSDSTYLIAAMTKWRWSWHEQNWITTSGTIVQNIDLFMKLCRIVDQREGGVRFEKVAGHSGVEGNEEADRLAVLGAKFL